MFNAIKKYILIFSLLISLFINVKSSIFGEIKVINVDVIDYYLKTLHTEISPIGSGIYKYPDESDINEFSEIINLIKDGNEEDISTASIKAQPLGYEIIKSFQNKSKNYYIILKEKIAVGSINKKGWGTYIINPYSENDIIIESPYPLNHLNTGLISVIAFNKLKARALLLPGAHRFSSSEKKNEIPISDVGLSEKSVFNAVHRCLVDSGKIVIQFQGYSKTINKESRKNYPPIILTNGASKLEDNLKNSIFLIILKKNLNEITLESIVKNKQKDVPNATIFGEDGVIEKTFSGKENVEGKYVNGLSEKLGNYFTIIYLEQAIRLSSDTNDYKNNYNEYYKIIDAIEKSINSFKINVNEILKKILEEGGKNIELVKETSPVTSEYASFDKNLIKDVTLLSTIFIVVTIFLLVVIILILIVALRYRNEIKMYNKKLKKLESYNDSLENEVKTLRYTKDEMETNYENEKKLKEKTNDNFEKEKSDKEYFFKGYNRLVSEKWELEKKLKNVEEELKKEKNKPAFEIECLKINGKDKPISLPEIIEIFNELIHNNKILKDKIREYKLTNLILDDNIENKITYILITGELKLKQVLKKLIEIVSQKNDENICISAIWAISEINGKDSINVLFKVIDKKNKGIHKYCKFTVNKIGYPTKESSDEFKEFEDIYKYLGFVSKENFITSILKNDDDDIRIFGLKIIEKYGINENLPLIFKALEDGSPEVRYEAVRVLKNIKLTKDSKLLIEIDLKKKIINALDKIIKNDASIYVRKIAAESLEKLFS